MKQKDQKRELAQLREEREQWLPPEEKEEAMADAEAPPTQQTPSTAATEDVRVSDQDIAKQAIDQITARLGAGADELITRHVVVREERLPVRVKTRTVAASWSDDDFGRRLIDALGQGGGGPEQLEAALENFINMVGRQPFARM